MDTRRYKNPKCPHGTRRNKKTGNCVSVATIENKKNRAIDAVKNRQWPYKTLKRARSEPELQNVIEPSRDSWIPDENLADDADFLDLDADLNLDLDAYFELNSQLAPTPTMQREDSFQSVSEIQYKESEIVTFSEPIENVVYYYLISKIVGSVDEQYPSIVVNTGNISPESPDKCLCNVVTYSFRRDSYPENITLLYNNCYKQYYLFSRIFKKMINCQGGRCITNPSHNNGKYHKFTQSSYCCGYYSAVAAVIYKYYQLYDNFPGREGRIDFSTLTINEINTFVTNFASADVNDILIKLFNLAISYTSYFSFYLSTNPLPGVKSSFPHTANQNCMFIADNGLIQLATIYATTGGITTTYHHFCIYNIDQYVIISDAWAAGACRRPLWTRFTNINNFQYVVNIIENNTHGLSPQELEIIKLFFLQPHCSVFLPNIKICYVTVDFRINDKLIYSNGTEMKGLNEMTYLMGGLKRKKSHTKRYKRV